VIAPVIDRIRKLLSTPETAPTRPDDLQIAVAVLLIEAARMDDTFDARERGAIEALLEHKFQLSHDETQELLKFAEETAERSHQLHPFTRLAVERMEPARRIRLIEMMWEVAYADGKLDPDEDVLLRRVAGLIYISDEDRIAARQRVLSRIGKGER
jgi:uncharacterized tellurite resistance protein B-like protein